MKRHLQETGIRKWFGDDLIELQSQPLKAIDELFKPYSSCVLSGCDVVNDTIAPGLVVFVWDAAGVRNAKVVPFPGVSGVAAWPQYLFLQETPVTREYQGGGVKNVAMDCKAAATSVVPVEPFIRILATGPEKTFRDVIQSGTYRFVTDAERTAWNAKWYAGNHPTTIAGYGITDIPTTLPASDVYPWAKAANKPAYTKAEVGLGNVTNNAQWHAGSHPTTIAGYGITDMPASLPASDVYPWAKAAIKPAYTAAEVGLGNVTNESKDTMFTNPVFWGKAGLGTSSLWATYHIRPNNNNHQLAIEQDNAFAGTYMFVDSTTGNCRIGRYSAAGASKVDQIILYNNENRIGIGTTVEAGAKLTINSNAGGARDALDVRSDPASTNGAAGIATMNANGGASLDVGHLSSGSKIVQRWLKGNGSTDPFSVVVASMDTGGILTVNDVIIS